MKESRMVHLGDCLVLGGLGMLGRQIARSFRLYEKQLYYDVNVQGN